jgi:hypothetical protein
MALSSKIEEITEENIRANVYKVYYQLVASARQIELLDAKYSKTGKNLQHDFQLMFDNGFRERLI